MVNTDKLYLMTQAALFEAKEKNKALKIVTYRRRDYIAYHMMLIMLSVTFAYLMLVGTILFMIIMAYETIVLNIAEMIAITLAIIAGYALVLIFYYIVSHKFYGEKHVKARKTVKSYYQILKELEKLNGDYSE